MIDPYVLRGRLGLYGTALPRRVLAALRPTHPALNILRSIHSGHIGDYAAWLLFGVGCIIAWALIPCEVLDDTVFQRWTGSPSRL